MPLALPSRRSLLTGAAGAAGAALLTGCSGDGDSAAVRRVESLERRMRLAAAARSSALLARYEATLAAHPALAPRLAPLRAAVAAHAAALAP
ncbi:hypothetical protein ABTZ17_18735, partial [Streptomyces sp. NPDC097619]